MLAETELCKGMMLLAALKVDSDEATPAEYREMVEQYYRRLSEDLR